MCSSARTCQSYLLLSFSSLRVRQDLSWTGTVLSATDSQAKQLMSLAHHEGTTFSSAHRILQIDSMALEFAEFHELGDLPKLQFFAEVLDSGRVSVGPAIGHRLGVIGPVISFPISTSESTHWTRWVHEGGPFLSPRHLHFHRAV